MKTLVGFLALVLLLATGCQNSGSGSTPVQVSRGTRFPGVAGPNGTFTTTQGNSLQLSGQFVHTGDFDNAAIGLADASIPDSTIVSPIQAIVFGGRVMVTNSGNGMGNVAPNSAIAIAIYDGAAGSIDSTTNQRIPPVGIYMQSASGSVSGNTANVVFTDPVYGTVTFQGQFDQSTFSGTVSYNNLVNATPGQAPNSGSFQFQIATCAFFVCN